MGGGAEAFSKNDSCIDLKKKKIKDLYTIQPDDATIITFLHMVNIMSYIQDVIINV